MSDLLKKISEATDRILSLQQERTSREASAQAHEQAAREDRLAMSACKKEIEALNTVVRETGVQQSVQSAQQAAESAKTSAEEVLARLLEKEKQLDAKLVEPPVEKPAE